MSSKITLWGRTSSGNVQKTLWALHELELPFTHRLVGGGHGGLDEPSFRAMNPNGLVPVLQDGDLTIWESHATLRYLAAAYGQNSLWREDARERAIVDQWTDWVATTYQPAWISVFWLVVRTPVDQHDAKAIGAAIDRTVSLLTLLEARLAGQNYLAGERLSYADIAVGVSLYRWFSMDIARPEMPNLERYYALLQQRAAFRRGAMIAYPELVGRLAF